ncbi:hypothetical protein DSL72_002935 [Monilinia vaccinii-corymbosi]|uniref:Uncharacterized protein n=1 Tax=Monilinia vaccinii-corymbosi TaxID=61207 RepID=A0A8A3PDS8_9HELO|nr:hypothetical protein DSL72_002935 [Monilinia vaccinii-corymbosi]
MEGDDPGTGHDPFPVVGKHTALTHFHGIFVTIPVEGKYTIVWLDYIVVQEFLSHTAYPGFRKNISNALKCGLFASPDIASHITSILNAQDGYQLGAKLSTQTVASLTLFRWLLIGYGSSSTRNLFKDSVLNILRGANEFIDQGIQRRVYVESGILYMEPVMTEEWLELARRYTGMLKYWLGVTGEQLIFQQRWGLPKQWISKDEGCWEPTWMSGSLEHLVTELWEAKSTIEKALVEAHQPIDYVLQYSDLLGNESDEDEDDFQEGKVLKFWPHSGKTEWVPSQVTEEEVRISGDLFMNAMSRRETARQNTAAHVPCRFPTHQSERDTASPLHPDRYPTAKHSVPQLRLNGFLLELGKDTAPQVLEDRLAKSQTDGDYTPQTETEPPRYPIDQVTNTPGQPLTGQDTTLQGPSDQLATHQKGEYITSHIQLDRSAIGHGTALQLEPSMPVTGQDSGLQFNLDIITTGKDTVPRVNTETFTTDQTDQDRTPQTQPSQNNTTQDTAPEIKENMDATKRESALQILLAGAPTGQQTTAQVQPAQFTIAEDTVPRVKTNIFATDHEAALIVRSHESTTGQEPPPIGKDTAQIGKSEDSKLWYSARNSPDTPHSRIFSAAPPPSDGTPILPAESNRYPAAATAPPTRPLPPLPQGKADENEAATPVEAPTAEELSDAIISNYAEALLAKQRQQPREVYPLVDYDSELEGERPSLCGCEAESPCNEAHGKQETEGHSTDRDSDTPPRAEGDTISDEVGAEQTNSGHDARYDRPCLRVDMADVEERLAGLDAAELRAMEERNQQDSRSLAEQSQLDLPERDFQLEEELQHSADIKEELLGKLESDTPIASKIRAVEVFFDAVGRETEKVQSWTEELLSAEAKVDRGRKAD